MTKNRLEDDRHIDCTRLLTLLPRLITASRCLALLFVLAGMMFRIGPEFSSRALWHVCLWSSLAASSAVGFGHFAHLYLGIIMRRPPTRNLFKRLAAVDFASEVSSVRRMMFACLLGVIVLAVSWKLSGPIYGVVIAATLLAPEILFLSMRMTPPLVLFLSASTSHDPLRSAGLVSVLLPGKRLITILRPDSRGISPSYDRIMSYRTHDDLWVTMLDELLDLTPIIVMDYRAETDAVGFELQRILDRRLGFKTIVLVRPEQAEASSQLHLLVASQLGVCVTTFDGLTYAVRIFSHPFMQLPSHEQSIQALIDDTRRVNPDVDFAVWGHPLPTLKSDNPGPQSRYSVR